MENRRSLGSNTGTTLAELVEASRQRVYGCRVG